MTELPLGLVSVLEVPPSLPVVVWVTEPSLRVSVLVVEPSGLFFVSVLMIGLLSELSRSEEEPPPPPELPPPSVEAGYSVMLPVNSS